MIREASNEDFETILAVINDASLVYKGVIPADCWNEPYMPGKELVKEIAHGVRFLLYDEAEEVEMRRDEAVLGVMGMQHVEDVTLIRHAYVRRREQNRGIGGKLLGQIQRLNASRPLLVGTWRQAIWAVRFYESHGFVAVSPVERKDQLLRRYWHIPERQTEESTVLTDKAFLRFRA